jgi:hypothetical protein
MQINQSWIDFARNITPLVTSLLTVVIAAFAIIYNRRSTKDTLSVQLRQRLWEKRTEIYVEMLDRISKQNPYKRPDLDWLRRKSEEEGKSVKILAGGRGGKAWQKFEIRVKAFSSDEVLAVYELWDSALSQYTWAVGKAFLHLDKASEHYEEAQRELKASMKAVYNAEKLLQQHIRAELRFEDKPLPDIRFETGISGVSEISMIDGREIDDD